MASQESIKVLKVVKSLPSAPRTMEGFTRIGYTPQSAIADLIDNSISAGASRIHITHVPKFGGRSVVYIADNGCGMDMPTLESAMAYGSESNLAKSPLSVYGIGMKAASTSFSRSFSVISRDLSQNVNACRWDLDTQVSDPWGMQVIEPPRNYLEILEKVSPGATGTVVIWENANLKLADPIERQVVDEDRMNERINNNIKEHLRLIFHRFLAGETRNYGKIEIFFNNELLEPWDPFANEFLLENWYHPEEVFSHKFRDRDGLEQSGNYSIQAFLLNPEDEGRKEVIKKARLELNYQGIYTYRDDRLIDMPGWLSLRTTRHNSLNALRFKFELQTNLDAEVDLSVKKEQIKLPTEMFKQIHPIYRKFAQEAEDRNRKRRRKKKLEITPEDLHVESSKIIHKHREDIPMPLVERVNRNDVKVENQYGSNVVRIREIAEPSKPENFVVPVKNLDDGVLYEPLFNGRDIIIQLNQNHDFYQKIYLAFNEDPLAIEALDNVLWAFARAELNTAANIRDQFVEMRHLVSSYLRRFAEEKEDPDFLESISEGENA